ncbi:hypothetical protein [Methylococcus sp. Mc7]|uniref:hypothetical protein n=1 Tax=Methylococcus sp. Mc7 TaxID=2860258 RepID=UPI002104BED2|nr:hypothetical protein [Methylococcus sp. Mc7]
MEASACGRLRELNQQHVEVALQRPLQCRILFELTEKRLRRCAQRRTCPLGQSLKWRDIDSQNQGDSEHAFIADQRHFQTCTAIDGQHQRNHTAGGKIDMAYRIAGVSQDIGHSEFDRLAARQ